jgi:hypothetical protein
MAATTTKGLRYPQNADAPNIAVAFQNLAEDVDAELDNYLALSAGNPEDAARAINFMLGGM